MPDALFSQLKEIGIDEELARQVSASADPDHNANKKRRPDHAGNNVAATRQN